MNFQGTEKYNIPYEKSWKDPSHGKIVGKVDWSYNHQKPKTSGDQGKTVKLAKIT